MRPLGPCLWEIRILQKVFGELPISYQDRRDVLEEMGALAHVESGLRVACVALGVLAGGPPTRQKVKPKS